MPTRSKKPCAKTGCGALVEFGQRYCERHRTLDRKQIDSQRGTAHERGYSYRWTKYRKWFLNQIENVLCRTCLAVGQETAAAVVDHIIPHKGNQDLFWDTSNHQPLCVECHNRKTAAEGGGFGRGIKTEKTGNHGQHSAKGYGV